MLVYSTENSFTDGQTSLLPLVQSLQFQVSYQQDILNYCAAFFPAMTLDMFKLLSDFQYISFFFGTVLYRGNLLCFTCQQGSQKCMTLNFCSCRNLAITDCLNITSTFWKV